MTFKPIVSAIVPARNEAPNIARSVTSLAQQPEIAEILVVNDESTDGTASVLKTLAAEIPQLRVIDAGPLPAGWIGKNHAAWLGAQSATCEWLLFTDADATHLPGSAALALADAATTGATFISYSPAQEMHTWWERALIPFIFCRLSQLYSYAAVNDPASAAAAANGQYLLIRRDAYELIAGHAAVHDDVLEDVALARLAKTAGVRLYFAPGPQIARVRMYETFGAMWEGWTKNLLPLIKCAGQSVTRELFSVVPWIPLMCFLAAPVSLILPALGLLLLAGRHASYAAMLRRNGMPVSSVVYYVIAVVLYGSALLVSDWRFARGKVRWKGRTYPAETGRA